MHRAVFSVFILFFYILHIIQPRLHKLSAERNKAGAETPAVAKSPEFAAFSVTGIIENDIARRARAA